MPGRAFAASSNPSRTSVGFRFAPGEIYEDRGNRCFERTVLSEDLLYCNLQRAEGKAGKRWGAQILDKGSGAFQFVLDAVRRSLGTSGTEKARVGKGRADRVCLLLRSFEALFIEVTSASEEHISIAAGLPGFGEIELGEHTGHPPYSLEVSGFS